MNFFRFAALGVLVMGAFVSGSRVSAQTTLPAKGVWLGTLETGGPKLRLQMHLQETSPDSCTLDSLDQKAFGIPCTALTVKGNEVSLSIPAVGGSFSGILSADGKTLSGTFTQGASLPLVLERQATAIAPAEPAKAAMDAALPPVPISELKALLDKDLAEAMKSGALAPGTHAAITIGVLQHGARKVFTYGDAKADSVYEIGSITKTFTGLILAQMVEQKKVRFDEPVRELLPPGTVARPANGAEITLLDLSIQHSGLPRMPDNFGPADQANPYADYDAKRLYEFMGKQGVMLPANAPFGYSNLGVGLLGQALANRAGKAYLALLQDEVTGPLAMTDTAVVLTPTLKARFLAGYDAKHAPAHAWDMDALAGAGGIRSTASDMLTYLEAQLHPEKLSAAGNGKTLPVAIAATHSLRAEAGVGQHIALNWFHYNSGGYWHNGATGGYTSYARFSPEHDYAIIVLSNTGLTEPNFTDALGGHIAQRLEGRAAVSLAPR